MRKSKQKENNKRRIKESVLFVMKKSRAQGSATARERETTTIHLCTLPPA